jgi:hypothetical protein
MGDTHIDLTLDDDLAALLAEQGRDLGEVVRERLVFDLYRRGVISSGKGAALLGWDRLTFIQRTGLAGIPYFTYDPGEVERELEQAEERWPRQTSSPTPDR